MVAINEVEWETAENLEKEKNVLSYCSTSNEQEENEMKCSLLCNEQPKTEYHNNMMDKLWREFTT